MISGSEVYQRLSPPIAEIAPRTGEPPVPFLCEVLLRPSASSVASEERNGPVDANIYSNSSKSSAAATPIKPPPGTYFFRGWADAPVNRGSKNVATSSSSKRERVSLRQQVAPRAAKIVNATAGVPNRNSSYPCLRPTPPPPAVFNALGQVAWGGGGKTLEKLATQEVTYVGPQLRIGRTRSGEVYVYERSSWPEDA